MAAESSDAGVESLLVCNGARASLMVERKLIHSCGRVAHVEDVELDGGEDGVKELLEAVKGVAISAGCYKVITACAPNEESTFSRHGFKNKGLQMRLSPNGHDRAPPVALSAYMPVLQAPLEMRRLAEADFDRGALRLLAQLTTVGEVSREGFASFVAHGGGGDALATFVLVDRANGGALVGIGTLLLIERAKDPAGKRRAHIEDIVIDEGARGRGLGAILIRALVDAASAAGAGTVVLECSPENAGFYSKLGFTHAASSMALYFDG